MLLFFFFFSSLLSFVWCHCFCFPVFFFFFCCLFFSTPFRTVVIRTPIVEPREKNKSRLSLATPCLPPIIITLVFILRLVLEAYTHCQKEGNAESKTNDRTRGEKKKPTNTRLIPRLLRFFAVWCGVPIQTPGLLFSLFLSASYRTCCCPAQPESFCAVAFVVPAAAVRPVHAHLFPLSLFFSLSLFRCSSQCFRSARRPV